MSSRFASGGVCNLYELADWTNGIAFRDVNFADDGLPVIKIAEMKSGITGNTGLTMDRFDEKHRVYPGDLLFSWSGSPETSIFPMIWDGPVGWLNQHIFKVVPKHGISLEFMHLLLVHLNRELIFVASNRKTTGLGHVTKSDLQNLELFLPGEVDREFIVQSLYPFFKLQRSSALTEDASEEFIQALFKSWFIDFDPVKAKLEGRMPYGMGEETAALFPDSFENSELGPIPIGWRVGMMEDVLSRKQDSTTPGEHLSTRYYVPIDNIDSKSLTLKNWLPYHDAASSLILFSKNDLLFGAMRPYFHKVTIAPFDGITRSTCFVFAPKVPGTLGFGLCLLNLDSTIRYSTDSSLGSTMPYAIWRNGLARHKIVLPPPQIMVAFSDAIAPLIEKIRDGGLMARNLSSTRDALLPRLMSGEIGV